MKKIVFAVLCGLCLCVFCGCDEQPDMILKGADISASAEVKESAEEEKQVREMTGIFVYICGAVENPGVYELDSDSRIYQLVELAGGMKKSADMQSVNLAEPLTDGEMVRIPDISESEDNGQIAKADTPAGFSGDGKVNINTAEKEQLMSLTGIGEAKAEQIIAYRNSNGAFRKIEDIMHVEGIKEGTYEKLKDNITVQ